MFYNNMIMTSSLDTMFIIIMQDKFTPLMIASQNGYIDIVNVLLQNGAYVDVQIEVSLTS